MVRRLSSPSTTTATITKQPKDDTIFIWNSIGDILGDGGEDQSGQSVAFNSVGDRIIMAAPYHLVDNEKKGHARIFIQQTTKTINDKKEEEQSSSWVLVGKGGDIGGTETGDRMSSVAMNQVGDRIMVGAPYNDESGMNAGHVRVFQEVNGVWVQIGQNLNGQAAGDQSGMSIDMDGSGTRLIIGAPFNDNGSAAAGGSTNTNAGHARIYQEVDGSWTQLGEDLEGDASEDQFGTSVAMSTDGKRVIIGAPYNDENGNDAGHVRVYEETNGSWIQVGTNILGEAPNDWSGFSVDINSNGERIIIGAPYNSNIESGGLYSGHARIYQQGGVDGSWIQVGNDIDGENAEDWSGYNVAMNSNGQRVVIGAPYNQDVAYSAGHARVYQEMDGLWTQMGQDLDGKDSYDNAGTSVDISSDGTRVVVGAPEDNNNYSGPGHSRVYELDAHTPSTSSASLSWWIYVTIISAALVSIGGLIMLWRKRNRSEVGSIMVDKTNKAPVKFPIPALDTEHKSEAMSNNMNSPSVDSE